MERQIQPAKTTESLRGMVSYKDTFVNYIYIFFTCLTGPSFGLPSGKRLHNYGKSPFSMGKSTINGHFR